MGSKRDKPVKLSAAERDLCNRIGFEQEVLEIIKSACPGAVLRQLNVASTGDLPLDQIDSVADFEPGPGLSLRSRNDDDAEQWAEELTATLPEGVRAWTSEDPDSGQAEVVVARAASQWEILRLRGTCGENLNLSTGKILADLERWDAQFGLTLLGAAYDWVEFVLECLPSDLSPLTDEFIALSPGLLDEGFNDLGEVLAEYKDEELPEDLEIFADIDFSQPGAGKQAFQESLLAGGTVYLWWD